MHSRQSYSGEDALTTEIAVLNRLGIALAADSAVTITGNGSPKVFDSGDKLFELSCIHPIAGMVNGNLHYLGVPWELLFKEFRDSRSRKVPKSMEGWATSFLQFVQRHSAVAPLHTDAWLRTFVNREVKTIWQKAIEAFQAALQQYQDADAKELITSLMAIEVDQRIGALKDRQPITSMRGVDRATLREQVAPLVRSVQQEELGALSLPELNLDRLIDLIILRLLTDLRGGSTGVVICGYAGKDLFPSLYGVSIDGWVAGRIRYQETHNVEITRDLEPDGKRTKELGAAISFAQTDVITRLLRGADSRFVSGTEEFLTTFIPDAIGRTLAVLKMTLVDEHGKAANVTDVAEFLASAIPAIYREKAVRDIGDKIEAEFKDTISLMPKQEIIDLAEALVGITAAERKATKDAGTVGGPIDVAFVTRTEGFVWIKRKHYFKPDLNPRFISRVHQRSTAGVGQ